MRIVLCACVVGTAAASASPAPQAQAPRYPQCEVDHGSRQERLGVEHFDDGFDFVGRHVTDVQRGRGIDDDAGNHALAERDDDARTPRRRREAVRNAVGEQVEIRNRNRD